MLNKLHPDFLVVKNRLYDPNNFKIGAVSLEPESAEYAACFFNLNELSVRFRVAKITPTKVGQFVTLWKRVGKSPIQPFDVSDAIDLFVVCVRQGEHFGQFVFPKSALIQHGILSIEGKGGKRAIRIYPPWDETSSKQAMETQRWQLRYFLEIPSNKAIDLARFDMLYVARDQET